MTVARFDVTVEDGWVGFSFNAEHSPRSAIQPSKRMVNKNIVSRHLEAKLHDGRAARRDERTLDISVRLGADCGFGIDTVEDLAYHVERGNEIDPAVPHQEPDLLTD